MPYYPDLNILFVHIPRTGGTRLASFLKEKNKGKEFLYSGKGNNLIPNKAFQKHSLQHQFYSTLYHYRSELDLHFNHELSVISIVRNPYHRLIDGLFWNKMISIDSTKQAIYETAKAFVVHDNLDNHNTPQYQFLIRANETIYRHIRIFRAETLTQNIRAYGFQDYNEPKIDDTYWQFYNQDLLGLVNDFYKKDFEYFGYTPLRSVSADVMPEKENFINQIASSKLKGKISSTHLNLVKFYLFDGNLIGEKKYVLYEGVVNNPRTLLVNTIEACDYILVDFRDIPDHKKTIEKYHYKTIIVDYSDGPAHIYNVPCWKYFKRSVINKKDSTFHIYDRAVFPIAYCIKTECLEFKQILDYSRNIDIAVFFETKGDYHHLYRSKMAAFIKENFADYNIHVGICGVNGEIGRSSIQKEYYEKMFHSKIVITCNPDNWEGDYRTFEAISTGTLVMVDQMKTPKINPLVDGKHIIYYDRENLEELKEKVAFFLKNNEVRTKIAEEGYTYTLQYHKAADRINEILSVISSSARKL